MKNNNKKKKIKNKELFMPLEEVHSNIKNYSKKNLILKSINMTRCRHRLMECSLYLIMQLILLIHFAKMKVK